MSDKSESQFALQAARYVLLSSGHQGKAYYATALYSLVEVEVPGLFEQAGGLLAVDKHWRLYYDPDMLLNYLDNLPALAGALEHEINHLLRDHYTRSERMNADPKIANFSSDAEINDDLVEARVTFPYQVITPTSLNEQLGLKLQDGDTHEVYYAELIKKIPKAKKFTLQPGAKGGEKGKEIGWSCGSCADGEQKPWEKSGPGEGKQGEGEVPKGIGEVEAQMIRADTAQQIIDHHAKGIGNVPGDLVRWAEGFFDPVVDWRRKLPHAIKRMVSVIRQGKMDYTYARPSRLQLPKVILPGMTAPLVNVDFFIDTSGSMSNDDIGQPVAEAGSILRSMQGMVDLWVYSGDMGMSHAQKLTNPKNVKLVGGGGTDMSKAAQEIEDRCKQSRRSRDILIMATDCETYWREERPAFSKVLVLKVGNGPNPPWPNTDVVEISPRRRQ